MNWNEIVIVYLFVYLYMYVCMYVCFSLSLSLSLSLSVSLSLFTFVCLCICTSLVSGKSPWRLSTKKKKEIEKKRGHKSGEEEVVIWSW